MDAFYRLHVNDDDDDDDGSSHCCCPVVPVENMHDITYVLRVVKGSCSTLKLLGCRTFIVPSLTLLLCFSGTSPRRTWPISGRMLYFVLSRILPDKRAESR